MKRTLAASAIAFAITVVALAQGQATHDVEAAITDRGPGAPPMTGPIYVEGAEDGASIDVRLVTIGFLHNFGVSAFAPGGGVLPGDFPYAQLKLLRWPAGADTVEFIALVGRFTTTSCVAPDDAVNGTWVMLSSSAPSNG